MPRALTAYAAILVGKQVCVHWYMLMTLMSGLLTVTMTSCDCLDFGKALARPSLHQGTQCVSMPVTTGPTAHTGSPHPR